MLDVPADDPSCPLAWTELAEIAPPVIPLLPADGQRSDECPADFDPAASCPAGAECSQAEMRGHTPVTLTLVGPEGSGRFEWTGLSVGSSHHFACIMGSTVGWRYLYEVGEMLAPLTWLADVDGDHEAELVVWTRLPWGDAEITNALMPVVYVLDGDRLVRRDDRSHPLRAKVGAAYKALLARGGNDEARACFSTLSRVLR